MRLLKEVSDFVQKQTAEGFMKSLSTKDQRIAQIENYYRRIESAIASFQVGLGHRKTSRNGDVTYNHLH